MPNKDKDGKVKDMATLPTIEVTAAQAQRLLSVFETTDEYKKWLRNNLIDYVLSYEVNQQRALHEQAYIETIEDGRADLGYQQT